MKFKIMFPFVLVLVLSLVAGAVAFSGQTLEISCENGQIAVNGSFSASGSAGEKYNVFFATYDEADRVDKVELSQSFTVADGNNSFKALFDVTNKEQKIKAFVFTQKLEPVCEPVKKTVKSLRILSIGNSFSIDAQEWLYGIAKDGGFDNVVIGNLYIGGCSLLTHYNNSVSGDAAYTYYKNSTGTWTTSYSKTMLHGITDEYWDYITLQQNIGNSGAASTYEPYLSNLIAFVNSKKLNPDAELVWHMTWAYDEAYAATSAYGSQSVMYSRIIDATQQKIVGNDSFSMILPSGTAIQNARTSYIGDSFNRDGFHLDYNYGRYLAALTWFHKITGQPIDDISYIPNNSFSKEYLKILKEAAKNAVAKPFEVTQSAYTTDPYGSLDGYELVDWQPRNASFYNSQYSSAINEGTDLAKRFISSKMFTRETLPVGSVIMVESGYGYRPEGWVDLDTKNDAASRPANVTTQKVVVTQEWWNGFNYRAFNLYKTDNSNIDTSFDEAKTKLKIYIPKQSEDTETTPEGYIDWQPMKNLYYNSLGSSTPSTNEENKNRFICSKIFTRDELPVGTVIEVDSGYQYRPEGWVSLNTTNTVRPNNVTTSRVVIDENWWGDYNYRAFNISKTNLSDICTNFEESCTHFRIYVPSDK